MSLFPLTAFVDNYIWMIVNEIAHTFICVDPGEASPVLNYAKAHHLQLQAILLTHHHADHIGAAPELLRVFPQVKIYGPDDTRMTVVNCPVRDEDVIHFEQFDFRVLKTPGHTSTHICYQEPNKGWLFCGDTLFSAGCGRVFDGTMEQLHHSLILLKDLPDETKIFCGHEYTRQNLQFALSLEPENQTIQSYFNYLADHPQQCSLPSTIALEKRINPFFRTDKHLIIELARRENKAKNSLEIFRYLRERKNAFQ